MKKVINSILYTVCILCICFQPLLSQKTNQEKQKSYKIWVTKMDKSSKTKGYLFDAEDSHITVMNYSAVGGSERINVNNINKIKFRRNGKPLRGLGYGALIGASIGAIIGFASGDDNGTFLAFSAGEKAALLGTLFSIPGAIIGFIAGHGMSVKIPIKGNQKSYDSQREKLLRYKMAF